ncbi:MAG: NDP-sugar synthase [Acidimicrobiales bacterium]|jgi:mannose-1-phosphate guanylyltransferase
MDAIVLVGGEGTRLRPLTYEIPKQMLTVVGRPMIELVVEWLSRHDVDRAVLSLGYRADAFVKAFPSSEIAGVALDYVVEPEPLDTAGAIRFAAEQASVSEAFLVLNGDVLTEFDASALVAFHRLRSAQASIALTPVADPSRFGVVPTTADGRVTAFIEKPPRDEAPTNLINAGIYVLETSVLDRIAIGRRVSMERETFPALVEAGKLYAMASDAYWLDTGTPQQFLQAQTDILSGRHQSPISAPEIRPGVWVDPTAAVAGAVHPHSFVGADASISQGSSVSDSVICTGAHIGSNTVVCRSLIMLGAQVSSNALVEDSIVGPGAVVGDGAHLSGTSVVGVGADVPAASVLDGACYPMP